MARSPSCPTSLRPATRGMDLAPHAGGIRLHCAFDRSLHVVAGLLHRRWRRMDFACAPSHDGSAAAWRCMSRNDADVSSSPNRFPDDPPDLPARAPRAAVRSVRAAAALLVALFASACLEQRRRIAERSFRSGDRGVRVGAWRQRGTDDAAGLAVSTCRTSSWAPARKPCRGARCACDTPAGCAPACASTATSHRVIRSSSRSGVGQVIPGWDIGVAGHACGWATAARLRIGVRLRARRVTGGIPPNATLVFEVELVSIAN